MTDDEYDVLEPEWDDIDDDVDFYEVMSERCTLGELGEEIGIHPLDDIDVQALVNGGHLRKVVD